MDSSSLLIHDYFDFLINPLNTHPPSPIPAWNFSVVPYDWKGWLWWKLRLLNRFLKFSLKTTTYTVSGYWKYACSLRAIWRVHMCASEERWGEVGRGMGGTWGVLDAKVWSWPKKEHEIRTTDISIYVYLTVTLSHKEKIPLMIHIFLLMALTPPPPATLHMKKAYKSCRWNVLLRLV